MSSTLARWKDIPGFENRYRVSDEGQVLCVVDGRILASKPSSDGYVRVTFKRDKKRYTFYVHILVLQAFGPPKPTDEHETNHRDGVRHNNHISNLEWLTHAENLAYTREVLGFRNDGEHHFTAMRPDWDWHEARS